MGLIGALIVIAPVLCDTIQTIGISATLEAPITSCRSLAFVPLSDHNWLPFLVLGPAFAIGAALLARRSAHRAG
jgi:hypothetical protein